MRAYMHCTMLNINWRPAQTFTMVTTVETYITYIAEMKTLSPGQQGELATLMEAFLQSNCELAGVPRHPRALTAFVNDLADFTEHEVQQLLDTLRNVSQPHKCVVLGMSLF